MSRSTAILAVAVTAVFALPIADSASAAIQPLPAGGTQVNSDPGAGIDPARGVSGGDPSNADVVGGALTAGGLAVPWAIFQQTTSGHDQVFVRAFKGGTWVTQGTGTAGGRSSSAPLFPASLNFDQGQDAEAPAIDFAGAGRTVPWATWYEDTSGTGFADNNIFASRFDPGQNKWLFGGQSRGAGGGVLVPSLNLHTNADAENPSVAGGSTGDPTKPGPWVTWQERTTEPASASNNFQIFVEKPIGPGAPNCDGARPAGTMVGGHVPSVGGFCWQQVGIDRVGPSTADPSLNVDPSRDGVEPDIAFTGSGDAVPWVVWYEEGASELPSALQGTEMVFAARAVSNGAADGGFEWQAVGGTGAGVLDTSGSTNHFGACAESIAAEQGCSLNRGPTANAEDPRVAAGTMNPGGPTVPWVTWDEEVGGTKQVFVSRLVGSGPSAHFELANDGQPISLGTGDATRPDITFSGDTPYVIWRQDIGGGAEQAFTGHFVNNADPTFVRDLSGVPLTSPAQADVREPISSSCTANPFNGDGSACQGGAVGTPFFLFTNGTSPRGLFADAYAPSQIDTAAADNFGRTSASLNGAVDPGGASTDVHFDYGPTNTYGSSTPTEPLTPVDGGTPFSFLLFGIPPHGTIHYRAVAQSDFTTLFGPDRTVTLAPNDQPHSKILGLHSKVRSRKLKRLRGSASDSDGIARVNIGLVRLVGGARLAKARCLVLRHGHLKHVKAKKHGRCARPTFVKTRGRTKWTFKLPRLPRGSYVAFSQAVDKTGKKETHFSARRGNERRFRVR